jgi:hypothetical protein
VWYLVLAATVTISAMWAVTSIFLVFSLVVRRDGVAAVLLAGFLAAVAVGPIVLGVGSAWMVPGALLRMGVAVFLLFRFGVLALLGWGFVAFSTQLPRPGEELVFGRVVEVERNPADDSSGYLWMQSVEVVVQFRHRPALSRAVPENQDLIRPLQHVGDGFVELFPHRPVLTVGPEKVNVTTFAVGVVGGDPNGAGAVQFRAIDPGRRVIDDDQPVSAIRGQYRI